MTWEKALNSTLNKKWEGRLWMYFSPKKRRENLSWEIKRGGTKDNIDAHRDIQWLPPQTPAGTSKILYDDGKLPLSAYE